MSINSISQSNVSNNRINSIISIATALLVFTIALGSFTLSYSALQDYAQAHGIAGWLSYVWPLLVDASLIVFSLSVVNAYLQAESTFKQWALVGIYSIATIAFNVLHAPEDLQSMIVAAIAPISLFFSFELLMSQLKNTVIRQGVIDGIKRLSEQYQTLEDEVSSCDTTLAHKNDAVSQLTQKRDTLQSEIDTLREQKEGVIWANDTPIQSELIKANDTRQEQIDTRRQKVLTLTGQGMSQGDIADELKVSLATIKRDTKALNGKASDKIINNLPFDDTGKDALKKSADFFRNGGVSQ